MYDPQRCPQCSTLLTDTDVRCPRCGFPLTDEAPDRKSAAPDAVADVQTQPAPAQQPLIVNPKTIDELKTYCAQHGMPLEKMRFFIGEDYQFPKAFGIYREDDRYIVYKNKVSGERSIRYHGPDEAYAVGELFKKLLSECHKRGIYPDGRPPEEKPPVRRGRRSKRHPNDGAYALACVIAVVALIAFCLVIGIRSHARDGYYRHDGSLFYRDSSTWYYFDDYYDDWYVYQYDYDGAEEDFLGRAYDDEYGGYRVNASDTWEDQHESSSSDYDSDYDSWDSSDTDWDSDW